MTSSRLPLDPAPRLQPPVPALPPTSLGRWLQAARQRWKAWRDRVLTSPDFQRRAARSRWLRPVARRRARGLFDLVAGFVYSQVLLGCVRLNLFERLRDGPQPLAALAQGLALPADTLQRLLDAAVALELLELRPGAAASAAASTSAPASAPAGAPVAANEPCYGLGVYGAAMVANPGIAALVEHHSVLYADLQDPVALLRGGGNGAALSQYWAYASADAPRALAPEQVQTYSALMSASQPLIADGVLDVVDLRRYRCLLDVGGGQGRFLIAAAARAPALRLQLFDLPGVVGAARAAFADAGLGARAEAHGGDFTRDPLPPGADIAALVRVIYDHPDERALVILRAVFAALPPGGTLLLAEPMAGATGAARMGDAYFGLYLLAMRGGRPRSARQLMALAEAAGFTDLQQRPTALPVQVGVLLGRKPG